MKTTWIVMINTGDEWPTILDGFPTKMDAVEGVIAELDDGTAEWCWADADTRGRCDDTPFELIEVRTAKPTPKPDPKVVWMRGNGESAIVRVAASDEYAAAISLEIADTHGVECGIGIWWDVPSDVRKEWLADPSNSLVPVLVDLEMLGSILSTLEA